MAYAPGDPNTPSAQRTKANGWEGSRYVGAPAPAAPAQAPITPPAQTNVATPPTSQPQVSPDKQWLDWINNTYGASKSRGAGFADMPTGTDLGQIVDRFNSETGANAKFVGGNSGDKVDFGNGAVDAKTSGGQLWYNYGPGGPPGGGGAPGGGGGGGSDPRLHDGIKGNYAAAHGSTATTGSSTTTSGVSGELYDMLMARAKQGTAINRLDPNIRQQVDPYTAQVTRESRNYLADMAEKAGPNANLRGEARLASERAGQASGMLESQLIGTELQNRRAEIIHALDSLGNRLTEDQRLALQKELGYLEDATTRYGIQNQANIAKGQLSLGQDRLGLDYSDLDWRMDPRNPANLPR